MLGFESVWVVLLPVQLTELIHPHRRDDLWLSRRGMARAARLVAVGSLAAWYGWTQRARPLLYHMPPYWPPLPTLLGGLAAVLVLIEAAWQARQPRPRRSSLPATPPPWAAGTVSFFLTRPWMLLIALAYGARPGLPPCMPLTAGLIWAAGAYTLLRRWGSAAGWGDSHRFAVICSAIAAVMTSGYGGNCRPTDLLARLALSAATVGLLAYLGAGIGCREPKSQSISTLPPGNPTAA